MVTATAVFITFSLNLLAFDQCTSMVSEEKTVVTAEGVVLQLDVYNSHHDFISALDELIQAKIQAAVQKTINNSRTKPELLLLDLDYKQYTFLNLLQSLSLKDVSFSNLLIQLISQLSTSWSTVLNNYLLTSIDFPEEFMYQVITTLAESNRIGLSEVPNFLIKDILKLTNATKIFSKACFEGNSEIVIWLLNLNNSPNIEALRLAWDNSHWEIVRILLRKISFVDERPTKELIRVANENNETILHFAAEANRSDTVKILIEVGAVVDSVSSNALTPLHKALEVNCLECIDKLLLKGVNVSLANSLLLLAIQKNNAAAFKKILKSSTSKEWKHNEGLSPIYVSVRKTVVSLVKSLLNSKFHENKDLRDLKIEESVLYDALWCQTDYNLSFSNIYESQYRIMEHMQKQPMKDIDKVLGEGSASSYVSAITRYGNENHIKMLINMARDKSEIEHAFSLAVKSNNTEIVDALIAYGVGLDAIDEVGNTALHFATLQRDSGMVERLLNGGANMTIEDMFGRNPAFLAILFDLEGIFNLYLKNDFDLNHQNSAKQSALYFAIQSNRTNIIRIILNRGASVNDRFQDEFTALFLAVNEDHLEIVNLLLDYGADVGATIEDGITALHKAAEKGSTEIVKLLISKGANLDSRSKGGWTPLHVAVKAGHLPVVKVIVESLKSIVNVSSERGLQSLHIVAANGNLDILNYLIEKGANLNARDRNLETPLFKATEAGHENVVKRLVQLHANLQYCTNWGWTPLHIASANGHGNIVKLLIDNGAEVNAVNVEGKTPLYEAAVYNREQIVFTLIHYSAKVNLPGKLNGIPVTPLKLTKLLKNEKMSDILRFYGGSEIIDGYMGPTYSESRIVSGRIEFIPSWNNDSLQNWLATQNYLSLKCRQVIPE